MFMVAAKTARKWADRYRAEGEAGWLIAASIPTAARPGGNRSGARRRQFGLDSGRPDRQAVAMTSKPAQDWQTLFRQRRELAGVRDQALQELQRSGFLFEDGLLSRHDLADVADRAHLACAAVTRFDQVHHRRTGAPENRKADVHSASSTSSSSVAIS